MYADGLTKGSVRRDRLRELADGKCSRSTISKPADMVLITLVQLAKQISGQLTDQ